MAWNKFFEHSYLFRERRNQHNKLVTKVSERRTETTEGRSGEAERDWEPIGDLRKHWRKIEGGEHRKELSQQRRLKPGRRPLHLPALLQWSKRNRSGYHWHADAQTDAPDD
jgi:hypothetical protein